MTPIMDPHNSSFKKELLLKLKDGPHPVLQISHQIKNTQGMFSPVLSRLIGSAGVQQEIIRFE